MNGTCPEQDKLLLFLEGELSADEADVVREHVGGCPHCEKRLTEVRRLTQELRGAGGESGRAPAGGRRTTKPVTADERCPGPELLGAYADGSVGGEAAAGVERHIAGCRSCLQEVEDLRALAGPPDLDVSDATVARVLSRLESAPRTAVLRWKERSLELVRGFASSLAAELGGPMEPALALARSDSDEIRLEWADGGTKVVGLVRSDGTVSVTGRVTVGGVPATSTSVALSSETGVRGPETPDGDGRFGPWALSRGRNVIRLTGVPGEAGRAAELIIELEEDEAEV